MRYIGLVYESVIVDTGESVIVYPQQWATGDGAEINGVPAKVPVPVYENICHNPASICPLKVTVIPSLIVHFPPRSNLPLINTRIHAKIQKNYLKRYLPSLKKRGTYVKTQSNQIKAKGQ